MIVADKKKMTDKSDEIVAKILFLIMKETENYDCEDDPAEYIYLDCHILGHLLARMIVILNNYATAHTIEKLNKKEIIRSIRKVSNEYIKFNKGK